MTHWIIIFYMIMTISYNSTNVVYNLRNSLVSQAIT